MNNKGFSLIGILLAGLILFLLFFGIYSLRQDKVVDVIEKKKEIDIDLDNIKNNFDEKNKMIIENLE